MRSRAAIGNHPIHPMLVPLPIGAFFLALVGDVAYSGSSRSGASGIGAGIALTRRAPSFS